MKLKDILPLFKVNNNYIILWHFNDNNEKCILDCDWLHNTNTFKCYDDLEVKEIDFKDVSDNILNNCVVINIYVKN